MQFCDMNVEGDWPKKHDVSVELVKSTIVSRAFGVGSNNDEEDI